MYEKFSGKGIYLIICATFFFALMSAGVKTAGSTIPIYEMVFFRALIGTIIIWMIAFFRKTPIWGTHKKLLLMRGFFGFCAIGCYFFAVTKLPLADATLLSYTAPIFTAVLSVFFLKERITVQLGIYLTTAFACIYIILKPNLDIINMGGLAAICSGFFASIAFIMVKKLGDESPLSITFYFTLLTTCLSAPIMGIYFVKPEPHILFVLVLNGVAATLAQLFLTIAILVEKVSSAAALTCLTIIFSYFLGRIFWQETLEFSSIIAGVVLIASSIIFSHKNLSKKT
ncbi:MAG: DMT family transporter [bacterium]